MRQHRLQAASARPNESSFFTTPRSRARTSPNVSLSDLFRFSNYRILLQRLIQISNTKIVSLVRVRIARVRSVHEKAKKKKKKRKRTLPIECR